MKVYVYCDCHVCKNGHQAIISFLHVELRRILTVDNRCLLKMHIKPSEKLCS